MALYNWTDGELVTAEKLNAYGEGMEQLKTDTVSAKTAAQAAAQSTETAKQSAQRSAASAETDAQRAEDAVAHNPTIQNGTWYVWNPDTRSYVSTDVPATGEMTVEITYQQGDSPAVPPTGAWLTSPPEVAQGKFLWTKILFSDNTIGYSVARQGVDGTGAVVSVNGKSGEVTLTTDDINEGTRKYMSAAEKTKLGNVPNNTNAALNGKVDKVTGKQLSTEDYTTQEKKKVFNLPENVEAELEKKENAATILTGSVEAGKTTIQFTSEEIKGTSVVDIYASIYGVMIEDMQISEGLVKMKIEAQESVTNMRIEVH